METIPLQTQMMKLTKLRTRSSPLQAIERHRYLRANRNCRS